MNDYETAVVYAEKLEAAGVVATVDPRSATPPCVLIGHTAATVSTYCAETVDFYAALMLPGGWNADAWKLGSELKSAVFSVLPVERRTYVLYRLALDSAPIPAYLFTWQEECDL